MPAGLRDIEKTLAQIVKGAPNSITMNKGIATRFMPKHAGKVPIIIQQIACRPDDRYFFPAATIEEVLALGADAIAVAVIINNKTEMMQLRHLAEMVTESERFGLPVFAHIYPAGSEGENDKISIKPDDIFYAARIGIELGVDVVKIPYTGDINSFKELVSMSPVPVVAAGGPKCNTTEDTVKMIRELVQANAAGANIGRNVWGFPDIPEVINTLKKAMFE